MKIKTYSITHFHVSINSKNKLRDLGKIWLKEPVSYITDYKDYEYIGGGITMPKRKKYFRFKIEQHVGYLEVL
jgi:hypothetical protein